MNLMNQTTDKAIARWVSEVNALYDLATSEVENVFQEAGFLPLSQAVTARINRDVGLDVTGYEHIVDTSSIRHILKHHGTLAEYKRGQVPITKQDFVQLTLLLLKPDTIEYAGKTKQGRDVLCYTKVINSHVVIYTAEIRPKKSRLAAVTLYKRINKAK